MDKKFITAILVLTLVIFIGGILFVSNAQTNTTLRRHFTAGSTKSQLTKSNAELPKPPDFTLPKYDGSGNVNLASSYNDKPTIIQFWATWCEFCRREFPVTNAIVATYKGQLNFIAVNFSQESTSQVKGYVKELGLDSSVLTFVMDETGSIGRAYGITGTPVHIFVKKGGELSLFRVGYMSPHDMKDEIAKII